MEQDAKSVEQWLREQLAIALDIDANSICSDTPMSRYGLNSLRATKIVAELSQWLGRFVSPVLVWEAPTLSAFAQCVVNPTDESSGEQLSGAERSTELLDDSIAVVGIACRFPGAPDPEAFWQSLVEGQHHVEEVGDERWSIDDFHDPSGTSPGRSHTRWAGLLPHASVTDFDPLFFNVSPREAAYMDPQQRMFLELSWEALQDAQLRPLGLRGSSTGVFVGAIWTDFGQLAERDAKQISMHTSTGKACNMVANRVSYTYGFEGPSLAIDTACSSSLVAVHLACQSLRTGDCNLAIAGGVNLILDPHTMVGLSKFGGLSPRDRCRAFDAGADGFVRGEGGGAVILKRLRDAQADGDRIYAVVRGSAVNNDGASNGLTAPSPSAQRNVLRIAHQRAGFEAAEVDYVEAHGTGTSLGDPIEAKALGDVLGRGQRDAQSPLRVGSVKTNIGHLEAAAGIAGFIKTVLSIERAKLPASLHFDEPNPLIPFDDLRIVVQDKLEDWPTAEGRPRRAGVSAFGWGGTNCHIALESAKDSRTFLQVRASGDDEAAAVDALSSVAADEEIGDGAHRAVLTFPASPREDVEHARAAALQSHQSLGVQRGVVVPSPKLAFVCAPQGGQWKGMARGLLRNEPVFRGVMQEFATLYREYGGWSLLDAVLDDGAAWAWQRVHTLQPMILAVQVGLAELWRSWGIRPDLVIGHSLGEITAAHISGALDREQTARLVLHYSELQASTDEVGTMAIVEADEAQRERWADTLPPQVAIAGYNSPSSVVLSGPRDALAPLVDGLQKSHRFARFIDVNVAAHSVRIDAIVDTLRERLSFLTPRPAHTPMLSTLTLEVLGGEELDASYWPRNLREPVRFAQALAHPFARNTTAFVELNPHPILGPAVAQCLQHAGASGLVLPSTRRGEDERHTMLEGLGALFVTGHDAASRPECQGAKGRRRAWVHDPAHLVAPARVVVPVSGRSHEDLEVRTALWREREAAHDARDVANTAQSLDAGFEHRTCWLSDEHGHTLDAITRTDNTKAPRKVAFVCPGQGSQWDSMARDLYATMPAFRDAFDAIARVAAGYLDVSLQDVLLADQVPKRIDLIQPLLFAVEVALGHVWQAWGVQPDAVVGHSMGEVAATHLAGGLSLADAVHVICTRSALLRSRSGDGAMLAAEIPAQQAREYLRGHEARVAIAVVNGPVSTVFSGATDALQAIHERLDARGVFCRFVKVDVASHSPQMDPLLDELTEALRGLNPRAGHVPIYSTVERAAIDGHELDADYWVRNLRETVHFAEAIDSLIEDGFDLFIELSPHPILLAAVEQCIDAAQPQVEPLVLPSMRRNEPAMDVLLSGASQLHVRGASIAWGATRPCGKPLHDGRERWAKQTHWAPQPTTAATTLAAGAHPLLGAHICNALDGRSHLWILDVHATRPAWLAEHRVQDETLVSVAVYVEMLRAALEQLGVPRVVLRALTCDSPLVLPDGGARKVQVAIERTGHGGTLGIFSQASDDANAPWVPHARGRFEVRPANPRDARLEALRSSIRREVNVDRFYRELEARGLQFGPSFRSVDQLWAGEREALGRVRLPEIRDARAYGLHPILLDGALQVVLAALGELDQLVLTAGVECFDFIADGPVHADAIWSYVRVFESGAGAWLGEVIVFCDEGRVLARIDGLQLASASAQPLAQAVEPTAPTQDDTRAAPAATNTARRVSGPPLVQALHDQAPGAARRTCFEASVRQETSAVLGLAPESIDLDKPLRDMGLTSLMAVELRTRLGKQIGARLSATLVWNYPTVRAVMEHLLTKIDVDLDGTPASAPSQDSAPTPRAAPSSSTTPPTLSSEGSDVERELLRELSLIDDLLDREVT